MEWIRILVTVGAALIGWWFVNWLNSNREINSKRRDLAVGCLIEGYRVLTQAVGRRPVTKDQMTKFENLLAGIQLFGSQREVDLAKKSASETEETGSSEIDPLIEEMRSHPRSELRQEPLNDPKTIWLRFKHDAQQGDSRDALGAGDS